MELTSPREALAVLLPVVAMLCSGAAGTVLMKAMFSMRSVGVDGVEEKFSRPWFVVFVTFTSMAFTGVVDASVRWIRGRCRGCDGRESAQDLESHSGDVVGSPFWTPTDLLLLAVPALFELAGTGCSSFGFVMVPTSVFFVLNGASIIFAAMLSIVFLGKQMRPSQLFGVLLCVSGVASVGLGSVLGVAPSPDRHAIKQVVLGMTLICIAQAFWAAESILTEYLLKEKQFPAMQIVGWQGVWGGAGMAVLYLVMYLLPGGDHGHSTDVLNTVALLSHSPPLVAMSALCLLTSGAYTTSRIFVTATLSAVHRTIFDALLTALVGALGLCVHYGIDKTADLGEAWHPSSGPLELIGFAALIVGQGVYGGMLRNVASLPASAALQPQLALKGIEQSPQRPAEGIGTPPAMVSS